MFIGALGICALLAIGLAPASDLGRSLRAVLVEAPARWLAEAQPRSVFIWLLAAVVLAGFALGAPELLPFVGMVDFSVCLDLMVVVLLAGGVRPVRRIVEAGVRQLRRTPAQRRPAPRAPRSPRARKARRPPAKPDPWPDCAFA